ncbi:MAG: hypothetical protein HON37_13505 [Candidatus Marinimicrobia bacterium]|nr:hypothetical protein [Candidatus Neomarinimicrobiota bacterium]MBT4853069.1 hypothetical protein [Candidatus Neomarinimicrobiota bacterium]
MPDFIITKGESYNIDEAKQIALRKLMGQIVKIIGSISNSSLYDEIKNNPDFNYHDFATDYENIIDSKSIFFESINSIANDNTFDFYWELKNIGKESVYFYTLRYHFPIKLKYKYDLKFKLTIQAAIEHLLTIEESIDNTANLFRLKAFISDIYFIERLISSTDQKYAESIKAKIEQKINNVNINVINSEIGQIQFVLKTGDKLILTHDKPVINTPYIKEYTLKFIDNVWILNYNTEVSNFNFENERILNITFSNIYNNKGLSTNVVPKIDKSNFQAIFNSTIEYDSEIKKSWFSDSYTSIKLIITINSKNSVAGIFNKYLVNVYRNTCSDIPLLTKSFLTHSELRIHPNTITNGEIKIPKEIITYLNNLSDWCCKIDVIGSDEFGNEIQINGYQFDSNY